MTDNKKVIFGFTGRMASGKGAAAEYLAARHGAATFRFSTILRDILNRLFIPAERPALVGLSEALRITFGQDILAKVMAEDVRHAGAPIIMVEGIRRLEDIAYLQRLPHFVLVAIEADLRVRYERLSARRENPDDATKTWEQFLADQERPTEITIPPVMAIATERIDNNGDRHELERQLDLLVKKYTT